MKVNLKIVCVVLLALCLVAENEGWWGRRSSSRSSSSSSSSRSSSSSSSRSSSGSSSSSSSSSSSRRRGWFGRTRRTRKSKPTASPFKLPFCSLRFGGCHSKEVVTKPPSRPTKASTVCSAKTGMCREVGKSAFRPKWNRCSARFGCIPRYRPSRKTKAPTKKAAPKARTTKAPVKARPNPRKSRYGKPDRKSIRTNARATVAISPPIGIEKYIFDRINICRSIVWLLRDILGCADSSNVSLLEPPNRSEVFAKKVVEMQIVEIVLGHCGYTFYRPTTLLAFPYSIPGVVYNVSEKYGEKQIECLHGLGVKTSISGKKDRATHSGMLVKTTDGDKYLIHKVKEGIKKNKKGTTIEVPNNTMYDKGYENVGGPIFPRKLRSVEKYFNESGEGYHAMRNNCHDATLRMKDLANKP